MRFSKIGIDLPFIPEKGGSTRAFERKLQVTLILISIDGGPPPTHPLDRVVGAGEVGLPQVKLSHRTELMLTQLIFGGISIISVETRP